MCLITIAPTGAQVLDWETLEYSHKRNDDGFGFAWYDAQSLIWVAVRRLGEFKELKEAIAEIPQDAPLVIHQRMSTKGTVSLYNTHPFAVEDALLFHNGSISDTGAEYEWFTGELDEKGERKYAKRDWSDTNAFAHVELAPLVKGCGAAALKEWWAIKLLEARIGYSNVLTITIDGDPDPLILNEKRGDWIKVGDDEKALYYSNSYSRPGKYESWKGGGGASHAGFQRPALHYASYEEDYGGYYSQGSTKTLEDAAAELDKTVEAEGVQQGRLEAPDTGNTGWAEMTQEQREAWTAFLNQEYSLEMKADYKDKDFDQFVAFAQYELEQEALADDDACWDDFDENEYYRKHYGYAARKNSV